MSSFIQDTVLKKTIDLLFLKYDRDRSNTLDMNQLEGCFNTLLGMLGVPSIANSFILKQLLKRMDKDNDGRISKQELLNLFRLFQTQQQQQNQNQGGWGQQQNQGGWSNQPVNNQPQNYNQPNNFGNQGGWGNQQQGGFGNQGIGPGSGYGY